MPNMELKTCEWCGKLFARPIPVSVKLGKKQCAECIIKPPEDSEHVPPDRFFRVVGLKGY